MALNLSLMTWNVRGMRNKKKRDTIFRILKLNKVDIVFLQETYLLEEDMSSIDKQWGGTIHYLPGTHHSGGLLTLFSNKIDTNDISLLGKSDRSITSRFGFVDEQITLHNIYAPCVLNERIRFFQKLKHIVKSNESLNDLNHTIVAGDFNSVLNNDLDVIAGHGHSRESVQSFQDVVNDLTFTDIWRRYNIHSKEYTWSRESPFTARRLDYIFISESLDPFVDSVNIKTLVFQTIGLWVAISVFRHSQMALLTTN